MSNNIKTTLSIKQEAQMIEKTIRRMKGDFEDAKNGSKHKMKFEQQDWRNKKMEKDSPGKCKERGENEKGSKWRIIKSRREFIKEKARKTSLNIKDQIIHRETTDRSLKDRMKKTEMRRNGLG